jgi:hypothetical protein
MMNYKKLASVEVSINENYAIIAEVNNDLEDENKFHCDLWLQDTEAGLRILIRENVIVNSSSASMCEKVAGYLETLVSNGYFNDDVKTMGNFISYVEKLKDRLK